LARLARELSGFGRVSSSAVELVERDPELAAIDTVLATGGTILIEAGAGMGKTALLDEACGRAESLGAEVLRARGSSLEAAFPFGVVRQLFERRLSRAGCEERDALLDGPAGAARRTVEAEPPSDSAFDDSFAVVHGLYWLAANIADRCPLVLVVDDVHWVDWPSLRWLAYLAPRLDGIRVSLLGALRPGDAPADDAPLSVLRSTATVIEPGLLTPAGVSAVARSVGEQSFDDETCAALAVASGGNPFYLVELVRSAGEAGHVGRGTAAERVVRHVLARVGRLDARALVFAEALAILGDGVEMRLASAMTGGDSASASMFAAGLVRMEILADTEPCRFLHPIVREAVEGSMDAGQRDAMHRAAARVLAHEGAAPGHVAAHLMHVRPAAEIWVQSQLRSAARAALDTGAPAPASDFLRRALIEPPPAPERVSVLRELAVAEAWSGRDTATARLDEALARTAGRRARAEIALELAETLAGLFRWVEAVDVIERALAELGEADTTLADRLEGELVVAAMHDARRASLVAPLLERLIARPLCGPPAEARAVATGMAAILSGRPAADAVQLLEGGLGRPGAPVRNWDTRAALLWSLITAEQFDTVAAALAPMEDQARRSGSARGLIATYSTLALLELRLGALPEADAAARVALHVLSEGDFAPGLAFGAAVLANVATEAGDLSEARCVLELLPRSGWPAGLATVLIPAAWGRLHLAAGRPVEAVAAFRTCEEMFGADLWGMELRDVGYLHVRSGAAEALLRVGDRDQARAVAHAELADVRRFQAPRAVGVALRVAGLADGGNNGLGLLEESVAVLGGSPARLEQAKSLVELGAARRRGGHPRSAREVLVTGLDLAAQCGARPLVARARAELAAAGARPRRERSHGIEALTPRELRVAQLAAQGQTNREIAYSLYVSLKTVEGHLARAYNKLGIEKRAELGTALAHEKQGWAPSSG
jgi:DNA-binding CsgD family transcriptional regulator